ncbi:MAG: hypothetical protein GKR97_21240 [Rhizobiaceae bacterium]|nr:hypothetical protein [Rhizobiaceae bacterium]
MTSQADNQLHEQHIMLAIQPLIKELLLVDVADLIAYLTFEQHNQIADIIDSATEQYFAPGFVGYREVGSADIDWDKSPTITLELVMNAPNHAFEFSLILESKVASIKLGRVNALSQNGEPDVETSLKSLQRAISVNSVRA